MSPWPVDGGGRRGAPAAPRPRRPGRHAEVQADRRAQHPRARLRPRDRRARRRRRAVQGVPARARRRGPLARRPDRLRARPGARARARRARTSPRSTARRCAAWTPRRRKAMVARDRRAAQGQRVARRRLRGAGLRAACPGSARTSPGRSASTGAWRWRSARSRRSRASRSATASRSPGVPGSQAHDEIFYSERARLLPRDQPRRRPRGRHDERRSR